MDTLLYSPFATTKYTLLMIRNDFVFSWKNRPGFSSHLIIFDLFAKLKFTTDPSLNGEGFSPLRFTSLRKVVGSTNVRENHSTSEIRKSEQWKKIPYALNVTTSGGNQWSWSECPASLWISARLKSLAFDMYLKGKAVYTVELVYDRLFIYVCYGRSLSHTHIRGG